MAQKQGLVPLSLQLGGSLVKKLNRALGPVRADITRAENQDRIDTNIGKDGENCDANLGNHEPLASGFLPKLVAQNGLLRPLPIFSSLVINYKR
ncbi:MAG: hypothetical protein WDO13_19930 [Verrucomicrobiota bacterium]